MPVVGVGAGWPPELEKTPVEAGGLSLEQAKMPVVETHRYAAAEASKDAGSRSRSRLATEAGKDTSRDSLIIRIAECVATSRLAVGVAKQVGRLRSTVACRMVLKGLVFVEFVPEELAL